MAHLSTLCGINLEKFHQRVVWRMQRFFLSSLDIFDLLNPNPNDVSAYRLSVLRFGRKYAFWGVKKHIFSMFRSFYIVSQKMVHVEMRHFDQ